MANTSYTFGEITFKNKDLKDLTTFVFYFSKAQSECYYPTDINGINTESYEDTSEYIKERSKINANDLNEITLTFDGEGKGTYTSNLNSYFDLEPYRSEIDKISNYKNLIENTIIEVVFTDEEPGARTLYTHKALLSAELDKDGNIVLYNDTLSDTDYDYTVENLRDLCGYDACSIADALNYPEDYFNKKALEDHYDEIMRFLNSKSNINKIYDDFDKFINEIQLPFQTLHITRKDKHMQTEIKLSFDAYNTDDFDIDCCCVNITNLTGIKLGSKHFEQIWDKDDISETIDIAGCVNKDDTPVQPETSNKADSQSPITALHADIEKLMEDIINDLKSARENDDETLLKAYSKQITKLKDIINRVKDDDKLTDDVKEATLDFISDIAAIFEYRKIGLATKLSIELTLKTGPHKPQNYTDKIKPNNVFTDEYYGFFISKLHAEHMVKAYKRINSTYRVANWSIADIMVNCLDIQEVNFTAYSEILIDFINDLERLEYDGFIIQVTKDKTAKINEDELIATCKTDYGKYLPDDFDYKNNIVLFRGRYKV